ncbi:DUF1835 domain-containing protein [Gelidibacter salicanalis]|uniref:DUF1835 domain-containing protein n=1 Tax=Gelidibacter salicanalis TaxID=291193 RepID=A0A5C7ABM6_9FLAO|nr:DUF1835 domain-containing protein [Gelidibacter salicanalis]TXE06026.1 DUF1835 domain-containing protein [Gelidibacter salicanalis]
MASKTLHITNGNNLTDYLKELRYEGHFLTWQEMLCEGPTTERIATQEFYNLRMEFLQDYYEIEINEEELIEEIDILNHTEQFEEIVLWFEYDLFCHINLMAIINLLRQKDIELPLYLVCSGRVKGEKELKALAELKLEQLQQHYTDRIKLSTEDSDLMRSLWRIYCGKDHNLFKPYIVQNSSFPYLSNCLRAHLERFPDSVTGLSTLETHTLQMIADQSIKSKRHLLGYILNFQGYYGFGDLQINRMIALLEIFYEQEDGLLVLNEKGNAAIKRERDFSEEIKSLMIFGGVKKLDFQFSKTENKLITST